MKNEILEKIASDTFSVARDVWGKKDTFVNFYMVRDDASDTWVLIDAGLRWSAASIKAMAAEIFGANNIPSAIILTHGHFDHTGALSMLLKDWNVPVYAHEMELPYLTGQSSYPPTDPSSGGGIISSLAFMYPTGPINISDNIKKLPSDGSIPGLSEWRYIETPGHSPGHVSLFRESDRTLIAGDAFITTKAESAFYALTFWESISGPPRYFTCDWDAAQKSLFKLESLHPEIVATGHGKVMEGEEMREQLNYLTQHFEAVAKPVNGRYSNEPAMTNKFGVASWPERRTLSPFVKAMALSAVVVSTVVIAVNLIRRKRLDG